MPTPQREFKSIFTFIVLTTFAQHMRKLSIKGRTEFFASHYTLLPGLVNDRTDLTYYNDIVNLLTDENQKIIIYNLMLEKLKGFVEKSLETIDACNIKIMTFTSIMRHLPNDELKKQFYNLFKAQLINHIAPNTYSSILEVITVLPDFEERDHFFEAMKDKITELKGHSFVYFMKGLRDLKHKKEIFEAKGREMTVENHFLLEEILDLLPEAEQREAFFNFNRDKIRGFIQSQIDYYVQFNGQLQHAQAIRKNLKEEADKPMIDPTVPVDSANQFIKNMHALPPDQKAIFFETMKNKLADFVNHPMTFDNILNVLPSKEMRETFFEANRDKIPEIVKFKIGMSNYQVVFFNKVDKLSVQQLNQVESTENTFRL